MESDWLFYEQDSQPMRYDRLCAAFQRLHRVLNLRPIRFYDLRHSWGTIHLRELRSPIQWVSRQMGHNTIALTADLYGFTDIDSDLGLANRLGGKDRVAETLTPPDDPGATHQSTPARLTDRKISAHPQFGEGRRPSLGF